MQKKPGVNRRAMLIKNNYFSPELYNVYFFVRSIAFKR